MKTVNIHDAKTHLSRLVAAAAATSERLPAGARDRIADPAARVVFSAASLWEIAVKAALGRDDFRVDAGDLHRDPFDRMLVAQARVETLTRLTADAACPGPIERV